MEMAELTTRWALSSDKIQKGKALKLPTLKIFQGMEMAELTTIRALNSDKIQKRKALKLSNLKIF